MKFPYVLPNSLISPENLCIGGLSVNPRYPLQDFKAVKPSPTTSEINRSLQTDYVSLQSDASAVSVRVKLSKLLKIWYKSEDSTATAVAAKSAITYQLMNSGDWFEKTCASPEMRLWMEKMIGRGNKIYLVIGYHTLVDTKHLQRVLDLSNGGARADVPVGTLLTGVPLGPIWDDLLDVGVDVEAGGNSDERNSYFSPGEVVYAVHYRRVEFKSFKRKEVPTAFLEKNNRWKVLSTDRKDVRAVRKDQEEEGNKGEKENKEEEGNKGEKENEGEEGNKGEEGHEDELLEVKLADKYKMEKGFERVVVEDEEYLVDPLE